MSTVDVLRDLPRTNEGAQVLVSAEALRNAISLLRGAGEHAAADGLATHESVGLQWPQARDVGRLHDMSPQGHLRVGLDNDNDVYVEVFNDQTESVASLEFCNPGGGGGGRSNRTRMALIALMVAMEADNAERPDLDWWALRMKPQKAGGPSENR